MRSIGGAVGALLLLAAARASAGETTEPERTREGTSPSPRGCDGTFTAVHPKPVHCLGDIETDRPHKTDSPKVLDPGHAQVEMGIMEYEIEKLGASSDNSLVMMNNIYKLGLAENVDIEVLHGAGSYALRARRFQLGTQMTIRSKLALIDRPSSRLTLVPAVIVPLAGRRAEGGGFVFWGGQLPAGLEFEVNLGAVTETAEARSRRHLATVVTAAITRRLVGPVTGFVEWYNDTSTADWRWTATADSGLLVLLNKNVQLDAGAYVRLWGSAPAVTPFFGVSARL